MRYKRSVSAYGTGFRRKQIIRKVLLTALILVILCLLPMLYFKIRGRGGSERGELRDSFESGAFGTAYAQSNEMLKERPLDYFLLMVNGFSAYQLAVAQINNFDTLAYTDACIWSLRKALLLRESSPEGRLFYVLGKAYYNKGPGYADLAVTYLEKARAAAYDAADIPEYLGLAYATLRDFRNSVAAFALALAESNPSDILLLSIARSYMELEEYEQARAYLVRCQEISRDSKNITAARLLLGTVLLKLGDLSGAEAELLKVTEENDENAEAHFQLGEIYAASGDGARARAEWRRALRIDPAHGPARGRINVQ